MFPIDPIQLDLKGTGRKREIERGDFDRRGRNKLGRGERRRSWGGGVKRSAEEDR